MSDSSATGHPLEIWGGIECTVNRVGDQFLSQMALSGHLDRIEDLDRFAELGITAIRYPVLWELTAPDGLDTADWSWPDARLSRLRDLGIRPIVGLLHHGSGPMSTNLLDPAFPEKLAEYAGAVAARYPWVMDYTPVNEPLTTGRFSALYGHWYPHHRDESSCFLAILTQCEGIAAAMRAIRRVNPAARLVQTEDMGEIFARPELSGQAAYENERRWLSLDLLTGRVVPGHPMWDRLMQAGIDEQRLREIASNPCPPDVIGINHYLTSERLLDERLDRYPEWSHGGNGRESYADIEAVRVCADGPGGWRWLLQAAWERYGLPVAATEVHLGCTREEQLRWVTEVWTAAQDLRANGADIRAITVWSLLGAFGWNRLVTEAGGDYEPGVFDLRAPLPRPTAIAHLVAELAAGEEPSHPVVSVPGWWRRPSRFHYPTVDRQGIDIPAPEEREVPEGTQGILVVGPSAPLGDAFVASSAIRAIPCVRSYIGTTSDLAPRVMEALSTERPWAVVVTAPEAVRPQDAREVASVCAQAGIPLLFCWSGGTPLFEPPVHPGESDLAATDPHPVQSERIRAAEEAILDAHPDAMVVRPSPPIEQPSDGAASPAVDGVAPAGVSADLPHLVEASMDLLIDGERGIWDWKQFGEGDTTWLYPVNPNADGQTAQPITS
ncbi:MAG: GH1 [uncultured Thermomicrobiales bacterium]|uniref:GH1 n=1 Tax=uncultured Thermomicrobiales bacterium TaxID=1645740 RepID=A0A6J4VF77_9BACT|nr:MAG: GH1 [uncultured Thermomicrobiales bacterium]